MVKTLLKLFPVLLILLLFAAELQAQSWLPLGPDDNTQLSVGSVTYTDIVTDPNGIPYVAYSDGSTSNKATVKKFDGNNWITVGSIGFSAGQVMEISLSFNGTTPYIAYSDVPKNGKATVMKFDGTNWVNVGLNGFSTGLAKSVSLAFVNGAPYIAYFDYDNSKAVVMKFDNDSWSIVGNLPASISRSIPYISFAVSGGEPYVAYADANSSSWATLKKYNGTAWVTVGTAGFSGTSALNISLAFNNNIPYLAYWDSSNNGKATVKRFDENNNWVNVGAAGFTASSAYFISLAFSGSTPYITYQNGNGGRAAAMMFNGTNWAAVGGTSISVGAASYISFVINGNTPYISYADAGNNGKATVQKLDGIIWSTVGVGGLAGVPSSYQSISFNGDIPYVAFSDSNNGGKVSVKKYDGKSWINVGETGFAAPFLNYFSLAISDGVPYLVYTDLNNSSKATVKKFDGSNWVTVGVEGFTSASIAYPSIKINNGVPYIVYRTGAYSNDGNGEVMMFNGTGWVRVGSSFSSNINYPSLAFNGNVPYVVYSDGVSSVSYIRGAGSTVKKYDGANWVLVGSQQFSNMPITNPTITFNGNIPYVTYISAIDGSETISKFTGIWETVANTNFLPTISGNSSALSTAFVGSTPYIAYKDASNGGKVTVNKFNGSTWVSAGTSGITANAVNSGMLGFNSNKLYLAYASNGAFVKYFNLPLSNNAQLSNLSLNSGTLAPAFNTGTTSYTASVPNNINNITLTPTVADATASVTVNGKTATSGSSTFNIPLDIGSNTLTTIVTAQDGTTTQTYTIIVNRTELLSQPPVQAQSWLPLGPDDNNQPSTHLINNLNIVIDANGTPYVAYADYGHQNSKITVKKFDGNSWVLVGKPGFSAGVANSISLAFNGTIPYAAYYDGGNGSKPTVMKFNGTSWEPVGPVDFSGDLSAGTGGFISLAFNNGIPYIAFADYNWGYSSGKATVMKFNGSNWIKVGSPGFSTGGSYSLNLAFNGNIPYVSYYDVANGNKANVMKFDGSNWVSVGAPGFSVGGAGSTSLAFNNNIPYVAYSDGSNNNKATVMKFDGTNWVAVGNTGFSKGLAGYLSLVFNGDTPFVTYTDDGNKVKATVMIFNAGNWQQLGEDFSADQASFTSLAVSGNTTYIAYVDSGNGGKATVKKLNSNSWQTVGTPSFAQGYSISTSLAFNSSTPYVAYQDFGNSFKTSVAKFDAGKWTAVGKLGFTAGETNYTSIAFNNAIPFVAYKDISNSNKVTVMKFDGSSWVTVGSPGFSYGAVDYVSIVINSGIPYVAYRDAGFGNKVTVMKFVNNNWEVVGWPGFSGNSSTVEADYISLAFNGDVPYIAYMDYRFGYTGGKATVMKFENGGWTTVGTAGFTNGAASYTSIAFNNNVPFVAYADGSNGGKATLKKFDGKDWISVGGGFSAGSATYTSLIFNGDQPYVSYQDNANNDKATVMKFDGSSWMTVGGVAGFSADEANSPAIAVNNNIVYVAYDTRGVFVKYYGASLPVVSTPNLSNLAVSSGTLSPVFSPDSTSYTASVSNGTTNITVTPTTGDANSTIMINGLPVISGTASAAIPLNTDINQIKTIVTAQDGTTQKTYTINVNRTKALQTITFVTIPAKTYGNVDFTPGATSNNTTIPITYCSSDPAVATILDGKIHLVKAGTVNIIASQAADNSFLAATDVNQILVINKAPLSIKADDQTKAFGLINPTFSITYDGFVNRETQDYLITKPNIITTATTTSAVGTYPITVTDAVSINYDINYISGTLTIGQANQTIVFAALPAKTYGDADFTLSAKSSSGLPVSYVSSNPLVATINAAGVIHIISAGTTIITVSQVGNDNIGAAASVTQNLVINKALVTITADNQIKTYGAVNPAFTTAYTGFVNNDTKSMLTAQPSVTTSAVTNSDAGSYQITVSNANAANYDFTYISGTLTISKAAQNITFAAIPAKALGDADFNPGAVSSSGSPIIYTSSNLGVFTVLNGKLHITGAGSSTIMASQPGSNNYFPAAAVSQDLQIIFTLPANNFTISTTGESCKGSGNGEINIIAANNLSYIATIVSAGTTTTYSFTNKLSVKNLRAGNYAVCITIAGYPDFKQCSDVIVSTPKDLSVYTVVNPAAGTLSLSLSGSSSYNISLNGASFITTKSAISLPLAAGKNTLSITTTNICQGVYEKTIELPVKISAYPNPFDNQISLSLANDRSSSAKGEVYNMQGRLVFSRKSNVSQGVCSFDLSTLPAGNYVLKLMLDQSETNIKIIKK